MHQEPSTTDGMSSGQDWSKPAYSRFGIHFGGIHLERAHRGGVTRVITPPLTTGFLHGVSAVFRPGAQSGKLSYQNQPIFSDGFQSLTTERLQSQMLLSISLLDIKPKV